MAALDEYLTLTEAADRLGVSVETMRRWVATKRIRHFRLPSGAIRLDPEDVDSSIREVAPEPKSTAS